MPQVNTLAIDVAPSNDFSPAQSGTSNSAKKSNQDFAQVIDQHYQSQQSGKNQENSGNKVKTAADLSAEKNTSHEKIINTDVQLEEKGSDTVSESKADAETSEQKDVEQLTRADKAANEITVPQESSTKETAEHQDMELPNKVSNIIDSPEQLMSFLSASQKILNSEVGNVNTATAPLSENIAAVDSDNKNKGNNGSNEKTEIDALLKQVLGGNKQPKTAQSGEGFPKDKTSNTLTEQTETQPETGIDSLAKKQKTDGLLAVEVAKKSDVAAVSGNTIEKVLTEKSLLEKPMDNKNETEKSTQFKNSEFIKNAGDNQKSIKMPANTIDFVKKNVSNEASLQVDLVAGKTAKQQMSASKIETLLSGIEKSDINKSGIEKSDINKSGMIQPDMENTPSPTELDQLEATLLVKQDKSSSVEKSSLNKANIDSSLGKQQTNTEFEQSKSVEKLVAEKDVSIADDKLNTDKVTFSGVAVPGEKQAQESNQNHSRVINQSTQKVIEPQATGAGEQSQEQSLSQQSNKQAQSLNNDEKLVPGEAQVKEKPFSELFDKKLVSSTLENTLSREIHQANEATKSAASAEEMITKLTSDNVQSTAQSASNSKQITSLQNEALSVYRKDFAGALKDKVMVMMNQKLQQVEIRLDPQELGNVNVKINLQSEQATINFTVQNQQAKEAFDQNLGRLKDMLAQSGVDVGDANVEQQSKQNDGETLSDRNQSGGGNDSGNDLSELSDTQTLNLVKGSSTGVDYYA